MALLSALGYVSGVSCAGRSTSHENRNGSGGSSAGVSVTGGVGAGASGGAGGTGKAGVYGLPEGGGAGNVPGNGGSAGKGAAGGVPGNGGMAATVPFPCEQGTYVSPDLVACGAGFVQRPAAVRCPPPPPDLEWGSAGEGSGGEAGEGSAPDYCFSILCGAGEACIWTEPNEGHLAYECTRVCDTDADCPAESICACVPGLFLRPSDDGPGTTVGVCRPSSCVVNADCSSGMLCIAEMSVDDCSPLPRSFHCQSPADECAGPQHCDSGSCGFRDGRFVCDDDGC